MTKPAGRPALIIANGGLPPRVIVSDLVRRTVAGSGLIVCADGGARHALSLGIRPHMILGDLDSLPPAARKSFRRAPIVRDPGQESTDLEKAIRYCIAAGCGSAVVVGALGDRIDHSTGALGCLRKYGRRFPLRVLDRSGEVRLLARSEKIATRPGEAFSLIPLGRCRGIILKGAEYPLSGESLEPGVREGISNRATGSEVAVRHASGALLLYRLYPAPVRRGGSSPRRSRPARRKSPR
ncbi:MAG TPA: thiamine diphosphokinase [Bacteroidota bacterium]|nr:thiamine diphosphokinase [Bacteroidota bacterium]